MPVTPETLGVLSALSDRTRLTILGALANAPSSISGLSRNLPITRQGTTKHLAILEAAGLVRARRAGRETVYEALIGPVQHTLDDLASEVSTWNRQLDLLKIAAEAAGHS